MNKSEFTSCWACMSTAEYPKRYGPGNSSLSFKHTCLGQEEHEVVHRLDSPGRHCISLLDITLVSTISDKVECVAHSIQRLINGDLNPSSFSRSNRLDRRDLPLEIRRLIPVCHAQGFAFAHNKSCLPPRCFFLLQLTLLVMSYHEFPSTCWVSFNKQSCNLAFWEKTFKWQCCRIPVHS